MQHLEVHVSRAGLVDSIATDSPIIGPVHHLLVEAKCACIHTSIYIYNINNIVSIGYP